MKTTTLRRILKNTIGTAMLAGALLMAPRAAEARVFISVGFAPPPVPVYVQPVCPGDGYIWTPGYWQYTDDGYQWVEGAWVLAPYEGALWTPGYWGYGPGGYFWNAGYWGPVVGYYGGINYGFGYFGVGFYGGYWNHGHFFYNREYNHFGGGFTVHNVYSQRINGFDGRPGGASFARGVNPGNRAGTLYGGVNRSSSFNTATNRGFNETARGGFGWNGGQARPAYNGSANGFAGNRGVQPGYSNSRPASNPRPSQGGGRPASAPAPHVSSRGGFGGGGSHGGGGGSHGGGHR